MPVDQTQLILLRKYQPDSSLLQEPLQASVSLDKDEGLPAINEDGSASPTASQAALEVNASPITKALLALIKQLEKKEE
ncbi:hypothetical protein [Pseudomonas chlororaphis]|uniref:hypothetical protein n=1 Tax=Pseudomonas chlororaphis TaxID=587753 RepID=UPI000F584C5D|nr:hypothetical protein [Pseudomonas chlororaphis]